MRNLNPAENLLKMRNAVITLCSTVMMGALVYLANSLDDSEVSCIDGDDATLSSIP